MMDVCILGITGSIGENTVKVCRDLGIRIVGATCKSSYSKLAEIITKYQLLDTLLHIGITDNESGEAFKKLGLNLKTKIYVGKDSNTLCIKGSEADVIVNALVGSDGIEPSFLALSYCKRLALANKETIVAAGDIILNEAAKRDCKIIPIDSEHGAILQCIEENPIKCIHITASGGPFWKLSKEQFNDITLEQALDHPNWKMGSKITIDSATMMNKGFEVIEASKLYSLTHDQIHVLIHPESIVHSMVEYFDHSIKAQLSTCDMKLPIQYALAYPNRVPNSYEQLDLTKYTLSFFEPDYEKFKCLQLAYTAVKEGNTLATVINAVNDICVEAFLKKKIKFNTIANTIERILDKYTNKQAHEIEEIMEITAWAKKQTNDLEEFK